MLSTPLYSYNMALLDKTLQAAIGSASRYGFMVHYALKANSDLRLLERIRAHGFGVDCVSGNEVRCAVENGFHPSEIVFAGVGKTDNEIRYAISQKIFCFNCESMQELEVINSIAGEMGARVEVALCVNPDVDPHTHRFISTGKAHSKFGISHFELEQIVKTGYEHLSIVGLHFHIGS
ncbi:MAG: diaminopimelate decarboxylase, partial [Rikenellaceae bacterium]